MKNALPSELTRIARCLYASLGTPLSAVMQSHLEKGDWGAIASVKVRPQDYKDPLSYFLDAQAVSFLKKFEELPSGLDTARAALVKWEEGERDCYLANERLHRYLPENLSFQDVVPGISEFFSEVQQLVVAWIGTQPPPLVEGGFGPGSTFLDRRGLITIPDKMSSIPTMTRDAVWHLPQWLSTQWGSHVANAHGEITTVPGNRFSTVPKSALTDRPIAVEPSINVFYQLAYGRVLKERMKTNAHWDMKRAQELHRQVAESSSVSREFATLDLSNASDTVSKTLVKLLLPPAWFSVLDGLRSPKTLVNGSWRVLEKFSSMGNGFTFELETLIFAALACTVSRRVLGKGWLGRDVYVYGDDIIIREDCYAHLLPVLNFCGFSINTEKSFSGDSPFRESCGGDFFLGRNVRPYYLKKGLREPTDFIPLANGLSAVLSRLAACGMVHDRRAWFTVLDCLPTSLRQLRGPSGLGDAVIHDEQAFWQTKMRDGIRYIRGIKALTRTVKFSLFLPSVVLACATYGTGNRNEGVTPRDGIKGYKVGWFSYS